MMFVGFFLMMATAACPACVPMGHEPKYEPMLGNYKITAVSDAQQKKMLRRLKGNRPTPLTHFAAAAATGDPNLRAKHYYLVRAGYVADEKLTGTVPRGLSLSVDVDRNGVAYITSYILSRQQGTAAVAVVLASDIPIKRVVSICGAAE